MKKFLVRVFFLSLVLIIGATAVFAGGGRQSGSAMTMAINFHNERPEFTTFTDIIRAYSASNPGISIELISPPEYEHVMRTRMAANDLPDLFSTHGWSVARYSEYLEPLNNRPWANRVNPAIAPVITNDRGQIFVLPFDVDAAGLVFNKDVLDRVGIDPFSLKTWNDFKAAAERIRSAGYMVIDIAGNVADDWTVGNFYDWVAPSFLITNESNNHRNALKNGTFDWNNWRAVAQLLVDFRDAGFLNPDYLQGSWENVPRRLGSGELAFGFYSNDLINWARQYNPNANFGFIPVPANSPNDTPTMITGERVTLGVWKNSPHKAAALAFLDHLSDPVHINRIAQIAGNQTGLVGPGYAVDTGALKPYFDNVIGVRGFPYFDREYLPSGMWDSLCKTGSGLLANTMTMDQVVQRMRDDYNTLRSQQQ